MAMGNYPYPDNYLSPDPSVMLPAQPITVACGFLETPLSGWPLMAALNDATAVYNNVTQRVAWCVLTDAVCAWECVRGSVCVGVCAVPTAVNKLRTK